MELRHLSYFIAVAEELSFTRGADRLRVSQPTLSQQIRSLEREVGGPLFVRSSRHVELTAAGQELLTRGREVLLAADAALLAARDRARATDGLLHIGLAPAVADYLLGDTAELFRKVFPGVRLIPHVLTSAFEAALVHGRIDVGIMMLPLVSDQVHFEVLGSVERVLFVPRHHPLARAGTVPLADVLGLSYVPVDRAYGGREFMEFWQLDAERGEKPQTPKGEPTRTIAEVGQRVARGEGVAVGLPGLAAYPPAAAAAVVAVDGLSTATAVIARRRQDHRPTTRAFCELALNLHLGSAPLRTHATTHPRGGAAIPPGPTPGPRSHAGTA
jgi:LysR family transcriptional regulator, benzoate and cis,cis-muconate-responsive activator of ben and cat genes